MTTTVMAEDQHQHQDIVVNNHIVTDDKSITFVVHACDAPQPPPLVEDEIVVVKPSFIDILNLNPNLEFEDKKKKSVAIRPTSTNSSSNSIADIIIANLRPSDAKDRVAVRAAEKRVWTAKSVKDRIRQTLDLKQADYDEAKHGYNAAVSDEQALKRLLKAKNVEISKAQSELKRFKSSGGTVENVLHNKGLVLFANVLTSIQDALSSSGISIHDLDWVELVDELLKPMRMEVVSLKENIRKAEVTTKASKKNHDKRKEELKVLKVQLKEAEDVFQEANRELMGLQNKEITEGNVDIIADKEEANLAKDAPDLPCVGQVDLNLISVSEICNEDVDTNSEKTVDNKSNCIDKPTDSDKISEPESGCNPERGLNNKEVDDAGECELVEEAKNEEEVKKVELGTVEHVERDTNRDEIHNSRPTPSTETEKKKKPPNKRERRALAKAASLAMKDKEFKEYVSSIDRDEYGCNLEQSRVSEQVLKLNSKEIDDDENTWNGEEQDKPELSITEIGEEEEETISNGKGSYNLSESEIEEEAGNDENHSFPSRKKYRNKKKQKKVARKARRAKNAELKALEGNGEGMRSIKMPFAISCCLMIMLGVMLWSVLGHPV